LIRGEGENLVDKRPLTLILSRQGRGDRKRRANIINNLTWKLLAFVFVAVLAIVPAGCDTPVTTTTPSGTPPPGAPAFTVDLVARDMAFDKETIAVPAGSEVYINFDNQDEGVSHNFALYSSPDAQTALFVGGAIQGPAKTTYRFPAGSRAGSYYFRCDNHPVAMNGVFVVTASETTSGGG
jgi:plastocyanin